MKLTKAKLKQIIKEEIGDRKWRRGWRRGRPAAQWLPRPPTEEEKKEEEALGRRQWDDSFRAGSRLGAAEPAPEEGLEVTMNEKQQAAEQIRAAVQNALKSKMSNDGIRDAVESSLPEDNWRGNKNPLS